MAAADVSALIDVASSPDPVSSPAEVTEETPVETPESETPEASEGGEAAEKVAAKADDKTDARTTPDAIRKALKALRDSSPENAPIARKLNDFVGRAQAYEKEFPKVADARNAKFLLDSVGGGDGIAKLQETVRSVNETDALLYAGDGKVLDSIYDDMKAAGKQEAFGKLASPFLDKLKENDPKAYVSAIRPHVFEGVVASGLPGVIEAIEQALGAKDGEGKPAPDMKVLTACANEMRKWFNAEEAANKSRSTKTVDPDRQAFEKERSDFETTKKKAFEGEVHGEWNRMNNQYLGEALKPYLKLPFAKNWNDATRVSVAKELMSTLLSELGGDKIYQSSMDALWSQKSPDKAKIIDTHKTKLGMIAKRIVKDVLDARYPGFSTVRGAPAPKPAGAKPAAAAPTGATKPIYQATKPATGDPNVDWNRTSDALYASGRFFDKKGVLRTWSPKYK